MPSICLIYGLDHKPCTRMEAGNTAGTIWMHHSTHIRTARATKGGGSNLFLTTDLRRIQANLNSKEEQSTKDIDHVALRIDHGEVVGRVPNPQELLALLGALAVSTRLTTPHLTDKCIGLDCKSLVDYINEYRHARMRNEVGKLPFLLAIQQYLQRDAAQQVQWVRSHPERWKTDKME